MSTTVITTLVIWLGAINIAAFVTFGLDKWRAVRREYRIREAHLLGLALIGGTAGALAAMWFFNHKTAKHSFRRGMLAIIGLQVVAGALLVRGGI